MKSWIMLLWMALLMAATPVRAQVSAPNDTPRELSRRERKALQKQVDSLQYAQALQAVRDSAFTLEANQVVFKYGHTAYVSSSTNFVAVQGKNAVVQIAFNVPVAGPNGLGGVTVEGMVSNYRTRVDKQGDVYVTFGVMGIGISAQVDVTLYSGSNRASVTITPNFNSRRLTLNGYVLPSAASNVFKGRSL